jgi:ATP-dependent Clp protease adapter protein ClpS
MRAIWFMLQAYVTGRCIVWTGSLKVAELKAEQLKSFGPAPKMKSRGASSLGVTVEPLPT